MVLLDRAYLAAYDSLTGQLVLLVVRALFTAGFAWLARIAAVPEPIRFFTTPPSENSEATTRGREPATGLPGTKVWS
jgi:hypothetical protein